METEEFKQKYECQSCHAFYETERGRDVKDIKCCSKPDLELLSTNYTDEEIKEKLNWCYENLNIQLKKYVDMSDSKAKLTSIWLMGTYFHEAFETYAHFFINATRGSGKTRLLKLMSSIGNKGDGSIQNNITEAVLFRIPRNTITCIDEMEQVGNKEKQTLREIINSCYKKGMKIKRMKKTSGKDGEQFVVEEFEPFFPIVMANIWGMDEVLGDRSITLVLEKSGNPAITKMIEDFDDNPTIQRIKRTLNQISVVSVVTLLEKNISKNWNNYISTKYNNTNYITTLTTQTTQTTQQQIDMEQFFNKIDGSGIDSRNFELLFPLLLISKEIGKKVFEELLKICSDMVEEKKKDEYRESKDVLLYDFISKKNPDLNYHPIKQLTRDFREFIGEEDTEDRWLNERWVGRGLKRLQLILDSRRISQGNTVSLNVAKARKKLMIFKVEEKKDE